MDSIGGMLDAFTAKEMICFNTKVLDEHLPIAFDVLSDLVLHPRFDDEDLAREKSVVLEEIKMDQDDPDYLVHEIFTQNFWRNHPLGKPILGTRKTVSSFSRAQVAECFRRWFAPENMVIAAAGNLEHQQLRDLVAREFGQMQPSGDHFADSAPVPQVRITTKSKAHLEQVHLCIGVPSYPMVDRKSVV